MIKVKCTECKKDFEAQRTSAKFCSANCRVKFNNKLGEYKDKVTVASDIKQKKKGKNDKPEHNPASWVLEIEDYCAKEGILPSNLIKTHKMSKNVASSRKDGKESRFKDFTQDKSYGKPYSPMDNPIFKSKMGLK